MTNTQIVIAELPSDSLTAEHFKQTTTDMPVAGDGQVLLKVILMSIDAANRSWMKGATYRAAVNAGDAMPTYAICEVVESNSDRLAVGDIVASEATWSRVKPCWCRLRRGRSAAMSVRSPRRLVVGSWASPVGRKNANG